MSKKYTEEEIRVISQSSIGKTFGELSKMNTSSLETDISKKNDEDFNKAYFGHLIETDLFDYDINSNSAPDFKEAGIELKVTPYKILKNGSLSAKERLVLNIINYMEEYKYTFYNSHFWYKNNKIQIIWYLYEKNKKRKDLKITHELLYTFPKQDLEIIKKDWEFIIQKIKDGKAHELSEADTMYLGACTKGANKNSLREQPFSNIKAMQRAFCLKTSYMTQLVRKYIGNYSNVEKVLKDSSVSFESFVSSVIEKYKDKSRQELINIFNIKANAKNINSILISRMFSIKGRLSETDEFKKANMIPKTIRIEKNGNIKESISFKAFKYTDIVNENWDSSNLKNQFEINKYMFFVFKKEKSDYIFKGIKIWNVPEIDIELYVKEVWEKTQDIIRNGNIVKSIINGVRKTNFPGISNNKVCHVRPHARDAKDVYILPVKDKLTGVTEYTKHCFWLNNSYIKEVLKEFM